ncbi:MAG: hypothetical protein QM704_05805 [Anaeromyxobacteraceae bacterium]
MGHHEDRTAWSALGKARRAVADAERAGSVPQDRLAAARRHLHAAEASDWFWWYGEDFTTELAAEFDALFRGHVARASLLVGAEPPPEVQGPIKRAGTAQPAGVEAKPLSGPTALLKPTLDGRETTYFEWQGSGLYRPGQHRGSMYGAAQGFSVLRYAFDLQQLYLRLDPAESPARTAEVATTVRVVVLSREQQRWVDFEVAPGGGTRPGRKGSAEVGASAMEEILELEIPFAELGLKPGSRFAVAVHALRGEVEVERLPRFGYVNLVVPDADFERLHWRV